MGSKGATFSQVPKSAGVNIEFQDLSYSVPQGKKGSKIILRSINGQFKSSELTAILGPSGAGKSTLLNILAGYKCRTATGEILINGQPRDIKAFRELSRYIMQEDLMQPMLTVKEAMMVAANLKMPRSISYIDKEKSILEVLEMLRLQNAVNTKTTQLSGGEKKRLSIALELLNNPPVLFLDEPTTGLDDLSCSQCVSLLKCIAQEGRTVICSIHTPSAKMFSVFDNVYIMSAGQCVYQGYGPEVVPFLANIGLECPTHYNPADFMIEIASEEYGSYQEKLVTAIENGKSLFCYQSKSNIKILTESRHNQDDDFQILEQANIYDNQKSSWAMQYCILLMRMWKQMWRDKSYLALRTILHALLGCLVGTLYLGMGKDGSKTIFNFGFYFTVIIFFMYIPMMPVLLQFPKEYQLIKREHFNKWYRLSAYFAALTTSTIPVHLVLGSLYIILVYILTDQPMEIGRLAIFYAICMLTGIISESLGLLIASQLSLVNAMFAGPVIAVPFMLLAVYGFGSGYDSIPTLIKIAMYFSYLRYSLEALIHTMLSDREKLQCPENEEFCIWTDLDYFIKEMGMDNTIIWFDFLALLVILVIFRGGFYYLLRQRLSPNKTFLALEYIGRLVKSQFAR
ncbi:ATP-binding cassette sub-family G member 1-like [Anthonomus grandis grandis]|uniref:ATP-binding cassette sub-family G member 1-like n=1 Tax=Anthonomus grandis grandis TaxID=2921223 RepID=UPI0021661670|nr:ATP-binding cassette sub-family G member 1-like [Anthonomus grandis grandis]